jgi:glycosyltransferase involved in cell wall biosynthesis
MKISIIIPVFNEKETIELILRRVLGASKTEVPIHEIIVVDDGSTDGTKDILTRIGTESTQPPLKILVHPRNQGKGAAIRTALPHIKGDAVLIQDADLEYHPEEYSLLVKPIVEYGADVVYGSRFLGIHRAFLFWHYVGNKALTLLTNLLFDSMLSDMEVGFKAFRTEVIKSILLQARGFDFEPEITAKVLKRKLKLYEVPITYSGRDYSEGKKITWRDGLTAIWTLVKYRFKD